MFNTRGNSPIRWQELACGSRSRTTLLSWVAGVARSVDAIGRAVDAIPPVRQEGNTRSSALSEPSRSHGHVLHII